MADSTTVKLDTETRDKINKLLSETELSTQNEMLNKMIDVYELQKTMDLTPELSQDVNELRLLINRIEKIYIGVGERFRTLVNNKDTEYNNVVGNKDSELEILREDLKISEDNLAKQKEIILMLNDELGKLKSDYDKSRVENEEKYNSLHETYESNKALVEEYKNKNDTLTGLVNEYKGYRDENITLRIDNDRLVNVNTDLQSQVDSLENNINIEKKNNRDMIDKIEASYKAEIERLKEQYDFKCDKALLELDRKYQDKINSINENWENKFNNSVGNYLVMINDLQKENRELQKELVDERNNRDNIKDSDVISDEE